jgi:hypothetical protein
MRHPSARGIRAGWRLTNQPQSRDNDGAERTAIAGRRLPFFATSTIIPASIVFLPQLGEEWAQE